MCEKEIPEMLTKIPVTGFGAAHDMFKCSDKIAVGLAG